MGPVAEDMADDVDNVVGVVVVVGNRRSNSDGIVFLLSLSLAAAIARPAVRGGSSSGCGG